MITEEAFISCSLQERCILINKFGVHLFTRKVKRHQVDLYVLDEMLVEIWSFCLLGWKLVSKTQIIQASDVQIEPYLDMIHLN